MKVKKKLSRQTCEAFELWLRSVVSEFKPSAHIGELIHSENWKQLLHYVAKRNFNATGVQVQLTFDHNTIYSLLALKLVVDNQKFTDSLLTVELNQLFEETRIKIEQLINREKFIHEQLHNN